MTRFEKDDRVVFRGDPEVEVFKVVIVSGGYADLRSTRDSVYIIDAPTRLLEEVPEAVSPGQVWRSKADPARFVFVSTVHDHEVLVVVDGQRSTSNTTHGNLHQNFTLEYNPDVR